MGFHWLHYVSLSMTDDAHTRAPRGDARRRRERLVRRVRPFDRSRSSSSSSHAVRRSTLDGGSRARRARTRSARATRRDARAIGRAVATRSVSRVSRRGGKTNARVREPPPPSGTRTSVARRQCATSRIESNRIESNERKSSCRARSRLARRVSRARRRLHRARRSRTSSRWPDDARRRREKARTGRPSNGAP